MGISVRTPTIVICSSSSLIRNYKLTDSDLEDDDEEDDADEDDADPSSWFEDDQDDGRKGQDIVEPDYPDEELAHVIRVDETRVPGAFYEPREGE